MAEAAPPTDDEADRKRFITELEFVQCLGNPRYLGFLAQQGLMDDKSFIAYVEYLSYWKTPPYAKFIFYPHCLFFLDMLQKKEFRDAVKAPDYVEYIWEQQFYHWLWRRKRPVVASKPEDQ
mmetsp:Transcript_53965/g.127427  ORF Transcript_53965/g.127427 Transcript_53965/m.127427 type:complete len:121 (-) Transcript_53965:48-410(-)